MGTITAKDGYKKYYEQVNGIMIVYRYRSSWINVLSCA